MQNDDAISTLNHLIAIAKDGVNGMSSAAEQANNPTLKSKLSSLSQERSRVANELQSVVQRLGGSPDDSGTTLGAMHRAYMSVKDKVTGTSDQALLDECERGEDVAVREFQQALSKDLPADIKQTVQNLFTQVKSSHDQVKSLRNSAGTA
jgi:uncharacterized protein (TIGR02284 family)